MFSEYDAGYGEVSAPFVSIEKRPITVSQMRTGGFSWEKEEKALRKTTLAAAALGAVFSVTVSLGGAAVASEYMVSDGHRIDKSLTGKPGNADNGRKIAIHRKKGNCLACHQLPIPEQAFHGDIGPDLTGVASRYSEGELRLRIVDPKVINEETTMPAFYRKTGFHRSLKKFQGKTIIGAQDVEDIIAYLMTLK